MAKIERDFASAAPFKESIRNIVKAYKLQHKEEYELTRDAVAMQRKLLLDPKYATMAGSPDHRAIYEISTTLYANLSLYLSREALDWLKTTTGGRWFAKTFPEFALPSAI